MVWYYLAIGYSYINIWSAYVVAAGGIARLVIDKTFFVVGLYAYHFTLHAIYKQQMNGVFRYSSQKLRIWNEVATIFLVAIVMLATVKVKYECGVGAGRTDWVCDCVDECH